MFLLVPAHPGFPGQIPQSRKTVVCVCVFHYLVFCGIRSNSMRIAQAVVGLSLISQSLWPNLITCFMSSGWQSTSNVLQMRSKHVSVSCFSYLL